MGKETKENKEKISSQAILSGDIKKSIAAVVLIMAALIFILSLIGKAGVAGQYIDHFLALGLGWGRYGLPILMVVVGLVYFKKLDSIRYYLTSIGAGILLLFLLSILHLFFDKNQMIEIAKKGNGGGYIGLFIAYFLVKYLGTAGGYIISTGGLLIGFILTFNFPLNRLIEWAKNIFYVLKSSISKIQQKEEEIEEMEIKDNIKIDTIEFVEDPKKTLSDKQKEQKEDIQDNKSSYLKERQMGFFNDSFSANEKKDSLKWKFPSTSILDLNGKKSNPKNIEKNAGIIKKTLHDFGIEVEVSGYNVGPTVVQYTFKPAVGVRLSKILNLQSNIALNLAASSVRIEAPIPGKSLVGVEVPLLDNEKALVRMKTVLESVVFKERKSKLSIVLGEDVNGDIIIGQIEKMPHLLIAGSTNTGKSVCINSILISLLYQNSPEDLNLILVDPKRVELSLYNNIPHLLTPVIVDTSKVVNALKWAINEMEMRYRNLQEIEARDIYSFNDKVKRGETIRFFNKKTDKYERKPIRKMPFIVIVIDELADLMAMHGREIEGIIIRLAQMARAVGIHLIVSTQRPSVNVLTGIIKANITTRIAFQVATQIDSRTILDAAGAEKLLGNGDMLYSSTQYPKPRRIQGAFVSEQEVKRVVREIKKNAKDFEKTEEINEEVSLSHFLKKADSIESGRESGFIDKKDEIIFEKAKQIIKETGKASTTFLQRKLGIGYPKAANVMDMLEEQGIVSPADGSKQRKVLINKDIDYENPEEDQRQREKWKT